MATRRGLFGFPRLPGFPGATGLRDAARLVWPVRCAGCELADVRWCDECAAPWWEEPRRCETGSPRLDGLVPALPVWSIAVLEGHVHEALRSWKDRGRRDLDPVMTAAMERAARSCAGAMAAPGMDLAVIPCPARPAHTRARGVDLPGSLARAAARGLTAGGVNARPWFALRASAGGSRSEGDRARWRANAPSPLGRAGKAGFAGGGGNGWRAGFAGSANPASPAAAAPLIPAVVVDDVVTTGATIARAATALSGAGVVVVGAIVLAQAPGVRGTPRLGLM